MKAELADYILCLAESLAESLAHTKQANDRPLLALVERGADVGELKLRVDRHERLLSNSWVVGDEHEAIFGAWNKFKALLK